MSFISRFCSFLGLDTPKPPQYIPTKPEILPNRNTKENDISQPLEVKTINQATIIGLSKMPINKPQEQRDPNLTSMHQKVLIQTKTTHLVPQQSSSNQNNQYKALQSSHKKENNPTPERQPLKTINYNQQGYSNYYNNNYGYDNSDGCKSEDEEACYDDKLCYEHGEPIYEEDRRCYGYYECDCGRFWESGNSWVNYTQKCQSCRVGVYPYCQHELIKSNNKSDPNKPHLTELCGKCRELGEPCNRF